MSGEIGKERPARAMAAAQGPVRAHRESPLPRYWKARSAQSARIGAGDDTTNGQRIARRCPAVKSPYDTSRKSESPTALAAPPRCDGNCPRALVLDAVPDRRSNRADIRYRRRAPQPDRGTELLFRSEPQVGQRATHRKLRPDRRVGLVPPGTVAVGGKRSPVPRVVPAHDSASSDASHLCVASAVQHDLALPRVPFATGDLSCRQRFFLLRTYRHRGFRSY